LNFYIALIAISLEIYSKYKSNRKNLSFDFSQHKSSTPMH